MEYKVYEKRVKDFLKFCGMEFLEIERGLIFYENENGEVFTIEETSFHELLTEWENEKKAISFRNMRGIL